MSANDTIPADLEPSASAVGGMFILLACCVMIPFICFLLARCGFKDRSKFQPSTHYICNAQSSITQPILYISFAFGVVFSAWAFATGALEELDSSSVAFLTAGATAAISAPHFLLPNICSRYHTEQGSDVPAPRPPPPGRVQPSEQVPGEDSTVPAQGRHLEQDDRSWSLDLESAFASEEEQRLL
ncbi:uncharacterized protein NECHADRAFT_84106 [Fusarium vanettenii 77-13-4]|uniref:Uncharacterized protein n=1 Tax=Fusarium vanettenii (strain ATCC MYA-4622 / CBS 123669 / FGSC 9596 / NRRL 45880 / 77-13-4) TaxID=660122 RepID=C7YZQ2_FUSV7|nr:uncharacterized protein NECHADRAFT_84106 [Fusarium vanettenii 77-13-4]EEU42648.1 predicted protein [Fusarium vanettenii 77-13-4]